VESRIVETKNSLTDANAFENPESGVNSDGMLGGETSEIQRELEVAFTGDRADFFRSTLKFCEYAGSEQLRFGEFHGKNLGVSETYLVLENLLPDFCKPVGMLRAISFHLADWVNSLTSAL
jgi:hypothetical protein